jgi:hypothetical protein
MDYLNLDTGVLWTITVIAGNFLVTILAIRGII